MALLFLSHLKGISVFKNYSVGDPLQKWAVMGIKVVDLDQIVQK